MSIRNKGTYGALGHQIIDSSLKSPPSFKTGSIYLSEIEQIRKSVPGNPGYKISTIVEDDEYTGTIQNKWNLWHFRYRGTTLIRKC